MIPVNEVRTLSGEWQLRDDVVEKDYVLGWLLAGISAHPALTNSWAFKGGTCLRKCYFETYRFSEDLDFTVVNGGPDEPADVQRIFEEVGQWLVAACGLELVVDSTSFVRRQNKRGNPTTLGRIVFRGPRNARNDPKVKIDLTSDEIVSQPVVDREVFHPYTDATAPLATVRAYSIVELLGEKLRALAERCRPRDLYDVIHIYRHPDLSDQAAAVAEVLAAKCAHAGIDIPTIETIHASPYRVEVETEWANMLAHQLPELPPFEQFWSGLDELFAWLAGTTAAVLLPRAELGNNLDPEWAAPRTMVSWGAGAPLETIRFAGANRLKVLLDYRAGQGRQGPRLVEPYSLRRTMDGHLLLFVVNDRGDLRSYRVDRIAGVSVTHEPFLPKYRVEF